MIIIKVVFLFMRVNRLDEKLKARVEQCVRETYCREFSCRESELEVSLCDGNFADSNDDITLAISSDKKLLNEGMHRDNLRKAVGNKLRMFLPKELNFNGRVGTFDGIPEKIPAKRGKSGEQTDENRAKNYVAEEPRMTFEILQIPESTINDIDKAIKKIELEREVFEEWGLYAIMPNPVCALSFYGEPGTGKTLAADALANKLNRKIIRASYADIESKYHGEGPKNVDALFRAAENQNAVLFIDEADSLLSKRLTNVTQGSEQAINSMRSQILICLERFHGIVIFATNLVVNYDKAFVSRLTSIEFKLPDEKMREKIWQVHLYPTADAKVKLKIPLAEDVNLIELAEKYPMCGRDIRNAVISACVAARSENSPVLSQKYLIAATETEIERQKKMAVAKDHTKLNLSPEAQNIVQKYAEEKIATQNKEE